MINETKCFKTFDGKIFLSEKDAILYELVAKELFVNELEKCIDILLDNLDSLLPLLLRFHKITSCLPKKEDV